MVRFFRLPAIILITAYINFNPLIAQAEDGLSLLEDFVSNTNSGQAEFTQIITQPLAKKEAASPKNKRKNRKSEGFFEFSRPGKFRLNYTKPYQQQIISDGNNLWTFDKDLRQATKRNIKQKSNDSPFFLITSDAGFDEIKKKLTWMNIPEPQGMIPEMAGLLWVQATPPKGSALEENGSITQVRLAFRSRNANSEKYTKNSSNKAEIAVLELLDGLGQTTTMVFGRFSPLSATGKNLFTFTPTADIEVITY